MVKNQTKAKVLALVKDYVTIYPDEYESFKIGHQAKRDMLADAKFGAATGTDAFDRVLGEVPETLFIILQMKLDTEELRWLYGDTGHKSGDKLFNEGPRWFFTTFKDFRTAQEI
jgi:hypothetical protein